MEVRLRSSTGGKMKHLLIHLLAEVRRSDGLSWGAGKRKGRSMGVRK